MIFQCNSPSNIFPSVLCCGFACCILWASEACGTGVVQSCHNYPLSWTISYFFAVTSVVLQRIVILQPLQWVLCYTGLSECRFLSDILVVSRTQSPLKHRWLYTVIAKCAYSVRVERKGSNFHPPPAAKSFEKALCSGSAEDSHY